MPQPFIEPQQLAAMLRGPDSANVLVLDVRDEDFDGGHIKGAINIESDEFKDVGSVDNAINQHMQPPITHIVVHCMFSQQRGPRCADALSKRLQEKGAQQAVLVLRGGFLQFASQFFEVADLLEDIDPNNYETWL